MPQAVWWNSFILREKPVPKAKIDLSDWAGRGRLDGSVRLSLIAWNTDDLRAPSWVHRVAPIGSVATDSGIKRL